MRSLVVLPLGLVLAACPPPPAQQGATAPTGQGLRQGPPGADDPQGMAEPAQTEPAFPADDQPSQPQPPAPRDEPQRERPKPPPPPPPPKDDAPDYAKAMVDFHNQARAKHCAKPLTWSPKLAGVAQEWANKLKANNCAFDHSHGKYGENLAAGTTGYMGPEAVVAMWYEEIKDYDFGNPGFGMNTGHFTQVVWKGTQQVGCGMVQCKGMDVWVCEYDPAGNWEGAYKENVQPTSCKK